MIWCPFIARVKVNQKGPYSRFLVKVCAVAMVMGLVKRKAQKWFLLFLKKNVVIGFFSSFAHIELT